MPEFQQALKDALSDNAIEARLQATGIIMMIQVKKGVAM